MKTGNKSHYPSRFSSIIAIAILLVGLQSCVKDNFKLDKLADVKWDPNLAAPLIFSSMSISDMLSNTEGSEASIEEKSDKSLTIVYKTNLFSASAATLVSLPDQVDNASILVGAAPGLPSPFSNGTFNFKRTLPVPFATGTDGPLIDSMEVKYGSMYFSFNSDLRNNGTIVITIPNAKKNGIPFSQTLALTYSGSTPVVASSSFDLTGYYFDMTQAGAAYNQFNVEYDITLEGSSSPIAPTDKIDITLMMNSIEFSKIFGYVGDLPLSLPADTLDLSIFTNSKGSGSFSLDNPKIKLKFSNSYGLPIEARVSTFQGYTPGVNFYPITGFEDPLPILSPNLSQVGQVLSGLLERDKTNSNIATIINDTPKEIILKIDAVTNPAGPSQNNFILDTSKLDIDLELELPLYGTAVNFVLQDTIEFSFNEDIPEEAESGLIRLANTNGFPIDLDVQVYFVDAQFTILDSLVSPNRNLSRSGTVDATTGRVISPAVTVYDAIISKTRFANLKKSKNLILIAKASTTNGGATNVRIYSDYHLDFKIGAQIQLHTKTNQ